VRYDALGRHDGQRNAHVESQDTECYFHRRSLRRNAAKQASHRHLPALPPTFGATA
jgi:hypothetical protein